MQDWGFSYHLHLWIASAGCRVVPASRIVRACFYFPVFLFLFPGARRWYQTASLASRRCVPGVWGLGCWGAGVSAGLGARGRERSRGPRVSRVIALTPGGHS